MGMNEMWDIYSNNLFFGNTMQTFTIVDGNTWDVFILHMFSKFNRMRVRRATIPYQYSYYAWSTLGVSFEDLQQLTKEIHDDQRVPVVVCLEWWEYEKQTCGCSNHEPKLKRVKTQKLWHRNNEDGLCAEL